jgi:predicted CoA-binding protein
MTTKQQVDDFLALKRIAVVGVSRDPKGFGTVLWQEFRQRRYDAIPVNPVATEIDGQPCYAGEDIKPGVDGVLIMTSKTATDQIVRDCAEAGVKHVWMYGGMAPGAATKSAVAFCEENGIDVVQGLCPYMFLPGTPPSTPRTASGRSSPAATRSR